MVRAGSSGEGEQLALDANLAVVGLNEVKDLALATTRDGVREIARASYPDASENAITNWIGRSWTFRDRNRIGDLEAFPTVCRIIGVQVKSGHAPEGERAIRGLQGVLRRFGATQGVFVSWGGYETNVLRRARERLFEVRLWDADDVIRAVLTHYGQLPDDIRAELPVKRVRTLVQESP